MRRAMAGKGYARQQGAALVLVLWLVTLLSIMATGHSRNTHTDVMLASRLVETTKARGLAEAAVNHVILQMLGKHRDIDLPSDGTVFAVPVRDARVAVAIRDATGLVDLNTANPELLDALFRAGAVDDAHRPGLIDAVLDWRDKDDLARLDGFEDADYRASGAPWTARDGAFVSVEELRYLPGMTQALYDRLAPLVTVYSGRGDVDMKFAPPALIAGLTGTELPVDPAARDDGQSGDARNGTFHIYAAADGGAETTASVEAVVRISRSSPRPFVVLTWREPARAEFPSHAGGDG